MLIGRYLFLAGDPRRGLDYRIGRWGTNIVFLTDKKTPDGMPAGGLRIPGFFTRGRQA